MIRTPSRPARIPVIPGKRFPATSSRRAAITGSPRNLDRTTPNPIQAAALALYAKAPIPELPVASFRTTGGLTFVQIQSGPGLAFGNVLYTGTYADIKLSGDERSTDRWFNTDGFARNSQQQLASNIRTMSSRLSTVRADGINTMDVSLQKLFKLREGLNLQLRGQAEGIANHPNFAPPNLAPTNTSFGKVTATQTNQEERRIFVSLKLLF